MKPTFALMILSFLSFCLIPSVSFSKESSSISKDWIQGSDLIPLLAATCHTENWDRLLRWDQFQTFLEHKVELDPKATYDSSFISLPTYKAQLNFQQEGLLTLKVREKQIQGKDFCDLMINSASIAATETAPHPFLNFIALAHAKEAIKESRSFETTMASPSAASALAAFGFIAMFGPFGIGPALVAVVASTTSASASLSGLYIKTSFEEALNQYIKVTSCNPGQIVIESPNSRIIATKKKIRNTQRMDWNFALVQLKNGHTVSGQSALQNTKEFFDELSQKCKNQNDAQKINESLKSSKESIQSRIAQTQTSRKSLDNVKPAPSIQNAK